MNGRSLIIRRLYEPPTRLPEHGGLLKGSDRAITICRLPLQTVGIVDMQQLLANLDTMSTLVSNTLASRAEPPPFGWTDITLEQTYKLHWEMNILILLQTTEYYKQLNITRES